LRVGKAKEGDRYLWLRIDWWGRLRERRRLGGHMTAHVRGFVFQGKVKHLEAEMTEELGIFFPLLIERLENTCINGDVRVYELDTLDSSTT
jgi:hypothetical protein